MSKPMSDKYIIKNCPALYGIDDGFLCSYREDDESEKYCYDCTDCVMKRIVEECTNSLRFSCERILAEKLLGLLDIQEVK